MQSPKLITTLEELTELLVQQSKASPRIGELAVAAGLTTPEVVRAALAAKAASRGESRLGEILVSMGAVTREALDEVLERHAATPTVDLRHFPLDTAQLGTIAASAASLYECLPLAKSGKYLVVAFAKKPGADQLAAVRWASGGMSIAPVLAHNAEFLNDLIARHYSNPTKTFLQHETLGRQEYVELAGKASTPAGFFRGLVATAISSGASDIHLRPQLDRSHKAQLRVDGKFRIISTVTPAEARPLIRHIEVIAGIDSFTKEIAKEGRLTFEHNGRAVDLRISIIPGTTGDSVVIRILDPQRFPASLSALSLPEAQKRALASTLHRPHGLIVAAGPTGSGKTTTLYTLLKELAMKNYHVCTVEDPVECRLAGVNQFESPDFSEMLPKLLRHDPDVIMVGELRDKESVEMAVNASLTGHLVLSTVHANDAASTVHRLVGLGAPLHVLSTCLAGVISQRLIRLTCLDCKGKGCAACGHTGCQGRTLAAEMARPKISLASLSTAPSHLDIVKHLDYVGGVTLDNAIVDLARAGRAPWEEVTSWISNPAALPPKIQQQLGYAPME